MKFKQVLTILRDLFMPQPRNSCPHCGGIRCIGACQFNEKQPVVAEVCENGQAVPQPKLVPDSQVIVQAVEGPELAAEDQTKKCANRLVVVTANAQEQK